MTQFKKINNLTGWIIFLIASFVYLSTMEKTVSLWDCGEFISGAYKLEVMHEPGAPLFLLIGRIFSLFATDVSNVAMAINSMSAICSSLTILFLFWTITAFGRKIYVNQGKLFEKSKLYAIIGSGIVGSLAYAFSDSFWFSAVEGEVYAMSSLFTAITFWCILKWEEVAGSAGSNKWLVLIAYLIGLSIGVHLLSLLTIPAMGMIYYAKNYEYSHKGAIKAFLISSVILVVVQAILIPKTAALMGWFEILFVNDLGMPFNSGMLFCVLLIFGIIIYGLHYTKKNNKTGWNTAILGILVLFLGYSSYSTVIIRANANPPINMSVPDDAMRLSSYLQREQYGDWPIVSGQNYNQKNPFKGPVSYESDGKIYAKNDSTSKYETIGENRKPVYSESSFFPRMFSDQRIDGYNRWRGIGEQPQRIINGQTNPEYLQWANSIMQEISFGENLKFFFDYQIGWSYMRYFMWNFAGRQNDVASMDRNNKIYGNWESGIGYSDEGVPAYLKNNKAKNHYYFLPLIIGLLGAYFHFKSKKTDALSVLLFFLFTGIFIIVYLNVTPDQPRERDYAYVGSFYAFAIWIGLGVLSLFEFLKKKVNANTASILATIVCLIGSPILMASENWDDHDRTGRTIALDIGKNYLASCEDNAILFTNGDNDTYPLWYAQEVEGIRTDIKIVNTSLLNSSEYIDHVKYKTYEAEGMPHQLTDDFYTYKGRATIVKGKANINKAIEQIKTFGTCPKRVVIKIGEKQREKILNNPLWTQNLYVQSRIKENPNWLAENIKEKIVITIGGKNMDPSQINPLIPNEIAILDMFANFNWERPVYFISSQGTLGRMKGLEENILTEGAVQALVPFKTNTENPINNINFDKSYDLLMNKYNYGQMGNRDVYFCHYSDRSISEFKKSFYMLTTSLLANGENEKAINLTNKYFKELPATPGEKAMGRFDQFSISMARVYADTKHKKGLSVINSLLEEYTIQKSYLQSFSPLSSEGNILLKITNEAIAQLTEAKKSFNADESVQNLEENNQDTLNIDKEEEVIVDIDEEDNKVTTVEDPIE